MEPTPFFIRLPSGSILSKYIFLDIFARAFYSDTLTSKLRLLSKKNNTLANECRELIDSLSRVCLRSKINISPFSLGMMQFNATKREIETKLKGKPV